MFGFYLLALIPIIIGGVLWVKNRQIIWKEWLTSSVLAFVMAGIFHGCAVHGMLKDRETWSGRVNHIEYHPKWVERWIEHHSESYECGTSGSPQTCTRHWTTIEYDTHREHWIANVDFGSYQDNWEINQQTYNQIKGEFGGQIEDGGKQNFHHGGTHVKGDRNIYATYNRTGFIRPITTTKSFENRIKAAPSVFSFIKVPTNINVYPWPENGNVWRSDRVLGTAKKVINIYEWDKLNSELGPIKQINLIIIGFESKDATLGQYQQAKFIGGRKNDLVITFGGRPSNPDWVYVFGWTESELVKVNIQEELYFSGINTNTIPFIKDEVKKNYKIKDWSKFSYISIEPRPSYYYWHIGFMILIQGGLWFWFHVNEFDKYVSRRIF